VKSDVHVFWHPDKRDSGEPFDVGADLDRIVRRYEMKLDREKNPEDRKKIREQLQNALEVHWPNLSAGCVH